MKTITIKFKDKYNRDLTVTYSEIESVDTAKKLATEFYGALEPIEVLEVK